MSVHSSTPLCIYRREPRGQLQPSLTKPPSAANGRPPRGTRRRWGPLIGRSACLVGRTPSGPTDLALWSVGHFLGPLVNGTGFGFCCFGLLLWWALLTHVLTHVASLICWNVMSWIKPHHYATKLAQNHMHTF